MWAVMCVCRHVCHTEVLSCLSAGVGVEPLFCLGFWDCGRACARGGGYLCQTGGAFGGERDRQFMLLKGDLSDLPVRWMRICL